MPEIKTESVAARYVPSDEDFCDESDRGLIPGSFYIEEHGGETSLVYTCPCGCGTIGWLRVGRDKKPAHEPSWCWTGGTENPTLTPSVHHIGHWHGWLRSGVWTSA